MSELITPQSIADKQIAEYLEFAGAKLKKEAIKEAQGKKCGKCGKKDNLKIIPLHETPHPMPSKIVLFCSACRWNEVLMEQGKNTAMKYFTSELQTMMGEEDEKVDKSVIKDKKIVDKMIKPKKKK